MKSSEDLSILITKADILFSVANSSASSFEAASWYRVYKTVGNCKSYLLLQTFLLWNNSVWLAVVILKSTSKSLIPCT